MDLATALVEMGVGLACLAVAWVMRGRDARSTIVALVLGAAGILAVGHAMWSLVPASL